MEELAATHGRSYLAEEFKLKLASCATVEKIIKEALHFYSSGMGLNSTDVILMNAYITGACSIEAARMIVNSNQSLAFAINSLHKAISEQKDVPGV